LTDFKKIIKYQISRKSIQKELICSMQTDKQTKTTKQFLQCAWKLTGQQATYPTICMEQSPSSETNSSFSHFDSCRLYTTSLCCSLSV